MRTRRRTKKRAIRASDLAKMAVCEQRLVYERHYGERLTRAQEDRIRDGAANPSANVSNVVRRAFKLDVDHATRWSIARPRGRPPIEGEILV